MQQWFKTTVHGASICALGSLALVGTISPAKAQALPPQAAANGKVCQTFISNALPQSYVGINSVNLGTVFSTVDTISGTITGTRFGSAASITVPAATPTGMWIDNGYGTIQDINGNTVFGWKTFMGYTGGNYPGTPATVQDTIDLRFEIGGGVASGISPGKTNLTAGTGALFLVQRAGYTGKSLGISSFNLTVCGTPAAQAQQCFQLPVSQSARASRIPLSISPTKKIVSITSSNITVAAYPGKPAETQAIKNPTGPGVARTEKFSIALNNREVLFFSVPKGWSQTKPIDTWRAMAGQPYLRVGDNIRPGEYVSPVNSWAGAPGAVDTPLHGNISGTLDICVQ